MGYAGELLRGAPAHRYEGVMEDSDRRNTGRGTNQKSLCSKGADLDFGPAVWAHLRKARPMIGVAWRLVCRGFDGAADEPSASRSAGGGLPLLLRFSGDRSFHGGAWRGETWRCGDNVGKGVGQGGVGFREQSGGRIDHGAEQFGCGHRRRLKGTVMIEHPPREHRLGSFLDPLIDQSCNFLAQIRSVVESGELKTLQRSARSRLQIIERRSKPRNSHGQSSNL